MGFLLIYLTPLSIPIRLQGDGHRGPPPAADDYRCRRLDRIDDLRHCHSSLVGHAARNRGTRFRLHHHPHHRHRVVLINWNPLIKLDGYHMLCEILGILDLKEASTVYVSSWVNGKCVAACLWKFPTCPSAGDLGFAVYAFSPDFTATRSSTVLAQLRRERLPQLQS